jgi:hypothetical protein
MQLLQPLFVGARQVRRRGSPLDDSDRGQDIVLRLSKTPAVVMCAGVDRAPSFIIQLDVAIAECLGDSRRILLRCIYLHVCRRFRLHDGLGGFERRTSLVDVRQRS